MREEREEKEGLLGRTGLKGVWLYGGLCFKERGVVEEQRRLTEGEHQMRSVPSPLGNDRRSLPAPLSLAKRQSRHASENPRGFRKKHNGNHISRVAGVGLAIVTLVSPL